MGQQQDYSSEDQLTVYEIVRRKVTTYVWRLSETLLPRRRLEVSETPESLDGAVLEADSPAKAVKHVRFPDGLRTPPKILESHQFNQEEIDLAEENARLKEQPPSQACDLCKLFYLSHNFPSFKGLSDSKAWFVR